MWQDWHLTTNLCIRVVVFQRVGVGMGDELYRVLVHKLPSIPARRQIFFNSNKKNF